MSNGAKALIDTLTNAGVDTCFTNPGTSEMHFVAALDSSDMKAVLCLFEGVATGAADGYARMADKPAATLLHLGCGLGNGLANLHNARKARVPMINIIGDHATYHTQYDAQLQSDIETVARNCSSWVRTSPSTGQLAEDAANPRAIFQNLASGLAPLAEQIGEDALSPIYGFINNMWQQAPDLAKAMVDQSDYITIDITVEFVCDSVHVCVSC